MQLASPHVAGAAAVTAFWGSRGAEASGVLYIAGDCPPGIHSFGRRVPSGSSSNVGCQNVHVMHANGTISVLNTGRISLRIRVQDPVCLRS